MTVLDLPVERLEVDTERLKSALVRETSFGIGAKFKKRRAHDVLDADWSASPITKKNKDRAWSQLGTSESGNHFVDYGHFAVADVCRHYSGIAMDFHLDLPNALKHLAWLELDSEAGHEYWAAMNLMGAYASANHECIHYHMSEVLGAEVLVDIENTIF